ncbi:unnamed protein product, partial [Rotaria magnacalcarata]
MFCIVRQNPITPFQEVLNGQHYFPIGKQSCLIHCSICPFLDYLDISFEMSSTSASVSTAAIVPSSISSSNTGQQLISSPSTQPRVCRSPYQELRHLESIWTDTNLNGIQYSEQHLTTVQTAQSANQLQHLHVNSDNNPIERAVAINNVSPHPLWVHHEMFAENGLIDRFKEVINDFIQCPGRQYAYDAN